MSIDLLNDDDDPDQVEQKKKYEEFLLAEYGSIAQAYFNTTSTIATFFRNYLVIIGLPIPALGYILTQPNSALFHQDLKYFIPFAGCVLGILGLCLMMYVVNLRLDALLYARSVNGIRKYFYDRSTIDYPAELKMRVLPRTTTQPRYYEKAYFLPVIVGFALLNTLYVIVGAGWYSAHQDTPRATPDWLTLVVIPAFFFAFHFVVYWRLALHRDTAYLRKYIIGVDIDGVLNTHRDTFCTKLWDLLRKSVWADQITTLPVHECQGLGVTEADEQAIFNHPSYWRDLKPAPRVAEVINKLRNVFGFKIIVFTHRPWPEPKTFPRHLQAEYDDLWHQEFLNFWGSSVGKGVIRALTKQWLKQYGIVYDMLVVEKGNVHTADPFVRTRNRFTLSERWEIRIFVEDDLFKALRLANVCEVVFLIDHPYNRTADLPRNVIRVSGWKDIYECIRQKL